MSWAPPAGFVPAPSKVPGIEVYAPGQAAAEARPTCPRCGAPAGFNPARGQFGCSRCDWTEATGAASEGPATFTRAALREGQRGWGATRKLVHCDGCGAEVLLPEGTIATVCTFCASAQLRAGAAEEGLRPHGVLPFSLTPAEAKQKARAWLGRGWQHPKDLDRSTVERLAGVYLPFWRFSASVQAHWQARVGYVHREVVRDHRGHEHVRETVRWRNEDGNVAERYADVLVSGTEDVPEALLGRLFPVQMEAIVPYQPELVADFVARAFVRPLAEAWEDGRGRMRERTEDACRRTIHGDHVERFSMRASFADERWEYVLLPVYIAAYRYQDKPWLILVNGRTGEVVGPKPVAWSRVILAMLLCLVPGLLGLIMPPVGLALLVAGLIGMVWIGVGAWRAERGTG